MGNQQGGSYGQQVNTGLPIYGYGVNRWQSGAYPNIGRSPQITDLVGQAAQLRPQINQALNAPTGATGEPDITSLVGRVGQMNQQRQQALTGPPSGAGRGK